MAYKQADKDRIIKEVLFEIGFNAKSLRSACKVVDVPLVTVNDWMSETPEIAEHYTRARDNRSELLFEDCLNIADDNGNDIRFTEEGQELTDHDVIQRAKVRIDTRKWMLGKMQPKKYGDKSTTIIEGGDKPIEISFED